MGFRKCPVCGVEYGSEVGFCPTDGAKLRDAQEAAAMLADGDPLVGTLIGGRYRILKRIGEGGMGNVYLAEHEAIEKKIAVKILKDQYAQREDVVARFQQEAKSASRVKHEGVLEVFDFGRTEDHRFFLAMELLDGVDLAHLLETELTLAPQRAVRLAVQIARALAAAHAKGIIHRDLKPENVFVRVGDDGREYIKIVDFGIAQLRADGEQASDPNAKISGRKLTKTGMIFGTPEYMSPEQAGGRQIDLRVDVYALGIILFEMLAGRTPFAGETFMAILSAHLMEEVPRLVDRAPPGFHCSAELEAVVRRALAKKPDERFRSMTELADALLATPEGLMDETLHRAGGPRAVSILPSGDLPPRAPVAPTDLRMGARVSVAPAGAGSDPSAATIYGDEPTNAAMPMPSIPRPARAPADLAALAEPTAASMAPPDKRGSGVAIGIALAAVVLIGVGGFVAFRALASDATAKEKPTTSETASASPPAKSAATEAASAPPTVASTKPEPTVVLRVETTPSGATLEREVGKDWVQVCDATPCDVKVPAGTTVRLRATKGGATAEKKLIADHDQKAQLVLAAPPTAPKPPPKPSAALDFCEVMSEEGIKVWRPCPKK